MQKETIILLINPLGNKNGELIHFEGPFKLYMTNEYGWWSVFYFIFPGFTW